MAVSRLDDERSEDEDASDLTDLVNFSSFSLLSERDFLSRVDVVVEIEVEVEDEVSGVLDDDVDRDFVDFDFVDADVDVRVPEFECLSPFDSLLFF